MSKELGVFFVNHYPPIGSILRAHHSGIHTNCGHTTFLVCATPGDDYPCRPVCLTCGMRTRWLTSSHSVVNGSTRVHHLGLNTLCNRVVWNNDRYRYHQD